MAFNKGLNLIKAFIFCLIIGLLLGTFPISAMAEEAQSTAVEKLYCDNTGEMLQTVKGGEKVLPNGAAQMITALLAVQKLALDSEITMSKAAVSAGPTTLGFSEGDVTNVSALVYGLVLKGADDCAYALAEAVSGTNDNFVALMNETAKNIGCKSTYFWSPNGNTGDLSKEYTTADDAMEILKVAMSDKTLEKILKANKFQVPKIGNTNSWTIERNEGLIPDKDLGIIGGLYGTAGSQVGGLFLYKKHGLTLYAVDFGTSLQQVKDQLGALIEDGKSKVKGLTIVKKGSEEGKARIKHGSQTRIGAYTAEDAIAYLPKGVSKSLLTTKVAMKDDLEAPIKKGQTLGVYQMYMADELVNEIPLVAKEAVAVGWFPSYIGISDNATMAIAIILGLIILLFIVRSINIRKAKKRKMIMKRRKVMMMAIKELEEQNKRRMRGGH